MAYQLLSGIFTLGNIKIDKLKYDANFNVSSISTFSTYAEINVFVGASKQAAKQ